MIKIFRRHRRTARRTCLVGVAAALLAPLVVTQPAGAGPATDGTAGHLIAAAGATIVDHSTEMPKTAGNEVTGDFLDKGYDQRAVVESGFLQIYDRDGTVISSTPTDLLDLSTLDGFTRSLFFPSWNSYFTNGHVGKIQLTWASGSGFFMAGWRTAQGEHVLYQLPSDGTCAQKSCAGWTVQLPFLTDEEVLVDCLLWRCAITTTALAVGEIGTKRVLAVGLSQWTGAGAGIYTVDPSDGTVLDSGQIAGAVATTTPVTDLDWDDSGSGLLAFSVLSDERSVYTVKVPADGKLSTDTRTYWDVWQDASGYQPLSIAIGHRADGSPVVAAGFNDGSVKLWDPKVTTSNLLAAFTGSTDPLDALTFTDRFDGTVGVPDIVAVASQDNSAWVLRYNGSTTLQQLPVATGGGTKTDVGGIRAWFPGYKTGSVQFVNQSSSDDVELDFATRGNADYGCWFAQDFADRAALPTTEVDVEAGGSSPVYALAGFTAGPDGGCAATDFTGQWAAYVTVTPQGRSSDRTVAKLVMSRSGQLTVQSVGGATKLVATKQTSPADPYPLGAWTIAIQSPAQPTPPTSITITGTRLDPAGTTKPVYRFDIPKTAWGLPKATPARAEAILPPMEVRGVTAAGADVSLGLLVPQGQPTRATSGSVTLSPVSFYWQNPSVGRQITSIYVQAGSTVSKSVNLSGLPAPAAGTTVSSVVACPASGSSLCDAKADPVANGLDQAPLRIQLHTEDPDGTNDRMIDLSDPAYGQVYYRDENNDLLTGLIPGDGSAYTRVSPYAGAYPNDNSSTCTSRCPTNGTVGGRFGYLTTTTTDDQAITAYVGGSTEVSHEIKVDAIDFTPQLDPGAQAGPGFYVRGCSDYSGTNNCRIANVTTTTPGLFLSTDPDTQELRIGIQLTTTAQTSLTSLPLQQVAGQPEHSVAAQPLIINNGEVSLNTTSGFQPADTIDTWLITHGTRLPVRALKVGGGN